MAELHERDIMSRLSAADGFIIREILRTRAEPQTFDRAIRLATTTPVSSSETATVRRLVDLILATDRIGPRPHAMPDTEARTTA